ncbi:hypothetical protein CXF68_08535 [Tenacibaculum sp. Bg11-29]|uniref:hypothetical protein n=1 Tax=Tenacibaculum sp. Bg11-29 TaxID=2058306 RepID=UPI000C347113|nr:hypothetical protein [Tenacibaculum sp. Bg11-29]PKH50734.1 hypothetical protein CXF68_08535 [Tenacibaculum sp. Bg11-29]
MKKTALFAILNLLVISFSCHSQTIESIIKNNATKTCDCIEKLEYIDSEVDLEIKFNKCSSLTKKDSIEIIQKVSLNKYKELFHSMLSKSCTAIATKIKGLENNYSLNTQNPLYTKSKNHKEAEKKVVGKYSLSFGSHNPSGGAQLYIYHQNKYAIISFGEIQVGTWKVVHKKYLHLIPNKKKHLFSVYGRYNAEIGDSTKTFFKGDNFSYRTLIKYGDTNEKTQNLIPIFNKNANCFKFPYLGKIKNTYNSISLAYNNNYKEQEEQEVIIYTYKNKQKFNDFIIYEYIKTNNTRQTRVIIDNDKLIFRKNRITEKKPLPDETNEDGKLLKKLTLSILKKTPKYVYYNVGCKKYDSKIVNSELYNFNTELNSYISIGKCLKGCPNKNDYDYFMRINKYELLEDVTQQKKQFHIRNKSIVYNACD